VFHSDFYRSILPFDFLTIDEQFFEDRVAYVFPLLELKSKSEQQQYNATMPNKIEITDQVLFIRKAPFPSFSEEAKEIASNVAY
jgi:hypothetical protein